MSRIAMNKVKIGVHWKNSISINLSSLTSSSSPRHPKLIELDPNVPLDDYIATICTDWKISCTNEVRFALRYDDTHKFVTEQNRSQIPTGQVFYLSLSHEDEVKDIIKYLSSVDFSRHESMVLERLKLAADDETFALEFVQQKGLEVLLKLFFNDEQMNSYESYSANLLRSFHNLMINQEAIGWDQLEFIERIVDQLIMGINASKIVRSHSSSSMMILHSMLNNASKCSSKIIVALDISSLLDYCNKNYDIETQFYALALINGVMSKGDSTLRSSLISAMSYPTVSSRLRELVQSVVTSDECYTNESFNHFEGIFTSTRKPNRYCLVQQLCLLQRFYLNELYKNSMNSVPDRSNPKYRDMINELRRSAFDTDLLVPGQSCQDLTLNGRMSALSHSESLTTLVVNPRRVEALQRDYERLGFQDLKEPIKDFDRVPPGILSLENLFYFCIHLKNDFIRFVLENSCKTLQQQCPLVKSSIEVTAILCRLFSIGIEPNINQPNKDYFLLFYITNAFFEQAFVRSVLLFNKTWKEMRAIDSDFSVVSSVVQQQISQSLDDISLINSCSTNQNRTLTSSYTNLLNTTPVSPSHKSAMNSSFNFSSLQRFTFDYFSERLNINNYKDVCRRRDELEIKREETIIKLPIVETIREHLRSHVELLTRQARLKTMKKGQLFMTTESRPGAKKMKNRPMFWQLMDNEKNLQCSESSPSSATTASNKDTSARDSSSLLHGSSTRTTISLDSIKDVHNHIDQSRSTSLTPSERPVKLSRHSNSHMSITISLLNETTYILLCENDYDMSCWSDAFNILLNKEMDSFYAREDMECLLNLLCQLQMLELDSPSIVLPQHSLPVPIHLPPKHLDDAH